MLENPAQLLDRIHHEEIGTGEDLYVSPKEWLAIAQYVAVYHFVQATDSEPPMFWFYGRRIRQALERR